MRKNNQTKVLSSRLRRRPRTLVCGFPLQIWNLIFSCYLCFGICHLSFAQEAFRYDSKGKRNPFIPLVTPDGRLVKLESDTEKKSSDLSLEGIIFDKNGISFALVNGAVVRIGDTIDTYQVLKIEKNKVIFIRDGQLRELDLKEKDNNK